MDFETLLHTSLKREELFTWQERIHTLRGKRCVVRVDTWEIRDHPSPGGETFTLYACAIVLTTIHAREESGRLFLFD